MSLQPGSRSRWVWDSICRIAADEAKKKELRGQLEDMTLSPDEKERIATEVDKLTKKIDAAIEVVLMEVLPEAFAIIRSTARRFKENATIKVLASEADRELSTKADFVSIDGDYANLKRIDEEIDDIKLVARALLPMEISVGSKLKYQMLQYEIV